MLHYSNIYWGVFSYLLSKLFIQYFSSGQHYYICKALVICKIMGKDGSEHAISTMQGDCIITYVQNNRIYIQKATLQDNRVTNWEDELYCVKIKLLTIKSSIIALFKVIFLPIGSILSNCSIFYTSSVRYLAT